MARVMGPRRVGAVMALGPLDPTKMTDTGMWIWAGILTAVGLAASYAIAVGWQRWKEKKRDA